MLYLEDNYQSRRMDRRSFILLAIVALTLQACISPPAITEHVSVPVSYGPAQRPAGVERLPIEVGIHYGPDFTDFKHQEFTIGRNKLEIPVGQASVRHFDNVFAAMFEKAVRVDGRPPNMRAKYGGDVSHLSAIIEVRLDDFMYDWRPMSMGPFTADVSYRVITYAPSGQTIASWVVMGSDTDELKFNENGFTFTGERVAKAMQMATDQLMNGFDNVPEIASWLASAELLAGSSRTTSATQTESSLDKRGITRLDNVTIEAALYNQYPQERHPYQSTGLSSPILAAHITVKNAGTHSILVRPSDISLSPRAGVRLSPVSVNRAARKLYQAPETEGSEVVGTVINPALGALMTLGEGSAKDREVGKISDLIRSSRLEDTTLGPAGSVSGFVYFESSGADGRFDEAELLVRLGEASSTENFEAALRVGHGTASTSDVTLVTFASVASGSVATTATVAPVSRGENASKAAAPPSEDVITAAVTSALEPGQLSGTELRRYLVGNTGSGKSETGTQFHVYHSANGKMVGNTKLRLYDVGTYTIADDGLYCREWTRWRSGGRDCFKAYLVENNRIRMKATNYHYESIFIVRPGDPEGLKERL